jgi:transposase
LQGCGAANAQPLTTAFPVMKELYSSEAWAPVPGFEGLYEVSTNGRIRSKTRLVQLNGHPSLSQRTITGRLICQTVNRQRGAAYARPIVKLSKNGKTSTFTVGRLVATAFLPHPCEHPCVLHKDDNPFNNKVENLEWGTYEENSRQAAERHRIAYGEVHHAAKLTDVDRKIGYELLLSGAPVCEVAKRLGVSYQTISDLNQGKLKGYPKLAMPKQRLNGSENPVAKLDEARVLEIKKLLAEGVSQYVIAKRFCVRQTTISAIKRGVNWGWLRVPPV